MLYSTLMLMMSSAFLMLRLTPGGSFPRPLSEAEERKYLDAWLQGDLEARNVLIERNLRLVAHIIKKYYTHYDDTDDLISIGTIGLIKAIDNFDPQNGRLQRFSVQGRSVLLNLAKNPTGFNQNLKIVEADRGPKMVAFFINDQVADGRDISWIWDIDFEELAG